MSIVVTIWLLVTYVLILFAAAVISQTWGGEADDALSTFLAFNVLRLQPIPFLPIGIPTLSFDWLDSLRRVLMWELSAFDSAGGLWLRYLLWLPLSGGVAFGLGVNVAPRIVAAVSGFIAAVPRPILYGAAASQVVAGALQLAQGG